jgi:hypothetical protein
MLLNKQKAWKVLMLYTHVEVSSRVEFNGTVISNYNYGLGMQ